MEEFLFYTAPDGARVGITQAEFDRRYQQLVKEDRKAYTRAIDEAARSDNLSMTIPEYMGNLYGTVLAAIRAEQNPNYAKFSEAERQAWLAEHRAKVTEWAQTQIRGRK